MRSWTRLKVTDMIINEPDELILVVDEIFFFIFFFTANFILFWLTRRWLRRAFLLCSLRIIHHIGIAPGSNIKRFQLT